MRVFARKSVVWNSRSVVVAMLAAVAAVIVVPQAGRAQEGATYGVYAELATAVPGAFDDVVATLRQAAEREGVSILADYRLSSGEDCQYQAHVLALTTDTYADQVAGRGYIAAFALPLRLTVFEDERGINIAAVNPLSLNRTIVAETGFESESQGALDLLKSLLSDFAAQASDREYGQMRDRGLIAKTMGLIAGGPFEGKVEKIADVDAESVADLSEVADRLYAGLEKLAGERKWETRPAYRYDLLDHGLILLGYTGAAIEAKAFDIVREGSDKLREDYSCPGVAHAAAFPIEIVMAFEDETVNVYMVDSMFRMKMYFEDAGKMKFAANMRMPPSIEDEIRDKVEDSLF
jgi:hypothetical protein